MGQVHERIDGRLAEFISAQQLFFVATAPLAAAGHVNVSPKATAGTFAVLDPHTVAYLDLTGSGAESLAHLRENGRVVVMFCAFSGPPQIVRLHGQGQVLVRQDLEWAKWAPRFPSHPGARAIVVIRVQRVSSSCGYGVPLYEHVADRDLLDRWTERKADGLADYQRSKNAVSIDGLPALELPAQAEATD